MNESDLLIVVGRLVRQPHRHRHLQTDRADRRRPGRDRPVQPGRGGGRSATRRHAWPRCPRPAGVGTPTTSDRTSPPGGRSGGPRRPAGCRRPGPGRVRRGRVRRAVPASARRRGRHRRRRQPRLLAGPLPRVRRPAGAHVRATSARSDSATRPPSAPGPRRRAGRSSRSPATAGSASTPTELTTAVKYGIPIKHVLLDNHALGKIAKEQRAEDFPVWHTSLTNPDWAQYARLCGATGIRVDRRDHLDAAMTELFAADGPALLCIEQDPELL